MTSGFEVSVSAAGDERLVRVAGEVDLETSPKLWEELRAALKQAASVVVDLQGVSYMDSSGVATLIQGLKHAGKDSVDFRLRDPSPRVMAVLELAQLPKLFAIERTERPG